MNRELLGSIPNKWLIKALTCILLSVDVPIMAQEPVRKLLWVNASGDGNWLNIDNWRYMNEDRVATEEKGLPGPQTIVVFRDSVGKCTLRHTVQVVNGVEFDCTGKDSSGGKLDIFESDFYTLRDLFDYKRKCIWQYAFDTSDSKSIGVYFNGLTKPRKFYRGINKIVINEESNGCLISGRNIIWNELYRQCSTDFNLNVCNYDTNGVYQNPLSSISFRPNDLFVNVLPGEAIWILNSNFKLFNIEVFDLQGRFLHSLSGNEETIRIKYFPKAVYNIHYEGHLQSIFVP